MRRRPRLFTLLLLAFALVIVLGVGGMVGFFSLAQGSGGGAGLAHADPYLTALQTVSTRNLADYYAAHGSWDGVAAQLEGPSTAAGGGDTVA